MDWASLLTFATVGVGLAVDFSSSGETTDEYADSETVADEFMMSDLDVDTDPLTDGMDFQYAIAEFGPDIDPDLAILPWGDDEIDAGFDDAEFTLTAV